MNFVSLTDLRTVFTSRFHEVQFESLEGGICSLFSFNKNGNVNFQCKDVYLQLKY